MSHNENRMDSLGKIIDLDIYNCMMKDRRTPLVLTPQLILDNSSNLNSIGPKISKTNFTSQSHHFLRNSLREDSNKSFKGNLEYIKNEFERRRDFEFHYFYKDLHFQNLILHLV